MGKSAETKRRGAALTPEETARLISFLESQLSSVRADVDRLAMKEQIDSIARRVADLEARYAG